MRRRTPASAIAAPRVPTRIPSSRPGRRPTRSMRNERRLAAAAVPRVLVAVGSPPGAALPAMSAAASVPAVTAAM